MDFNVVGIGEVLWDLLLTGPQLGGAPANFAYHSNALGAHAYVITRVGDDEHGREIIRRFREMGIRSGAIQIDERAPTGTATVALSGNGLAHFTVHENVAWDFIAATHEAVALVAKAHAICFGSLAQRSNSSRQAIQQLLAAAPIDSVRVFDINLRQKFYSRAVIEPSLLIANVLKLNDDELPIIAEMLGLRGTIEPQMKQLAATFHLRLIALTRGAQGSVLYQSGTGSHGEERWSNCPSRPVDVADTVGAGDSFTAALVMGLLRKMDLDELNLLANDVARYVCSHTGATPALPLEFAKRFEFDRSRA